jgi:cytochrome c
MPASHSIFRYLLFSVGLAIVLASILFRNTVLAQEPTPTPDRLAEPTLPTAPSQADLGAQVYWLSCLPCHGDFGQGLTDEFRQVYPPEDRNCWNSGCHGQRPYDNGFILPTQVPAVIGKNALQKFPNAAVLRAYIFVAMPYWKPGSLTDEESWQVTAFILRESGLWDAQEEINASNADQIRVGAREAVSNPEADPVSPSSALVWGIIIGLGILLLLLLLLRFVRSSNQSS